MDCKDKLADSAWKDSWTKDPIMFLSGCANSLCKRAASDEASPESVLMVVNSTENGGMAYAAYPGGRASVLSMGTVTICASPKKWVSLLLLGSAEAMPVKKSPKNQVDVTM